ncbi:MAG: hypothetical protein OEY63_00610 [Gemmatimonadota bacterium]|nr:hypothetical protein [Gemmatimonadota bacterium]
MVTSDINAQTYPTEQTVAGALNATDVSVQFTAGATIVRFMPLEEELLRLMSPDTRSALTPLKDRIDDQTRFESTTERFAVLVTFFGLQPDAHFSPDEIQILSRNQMFFPFDVKPITPQWHQHRVNQGESVSAVYWFPSGITIWEPIEFVYGEHKTDDWSRIIPTLERERARTGGN